MMESTMVKSFEQKTRFVFLEFSGSYFSGFVSMFSPSRSRFALVGIVTFFKMKQLPRSTCWIDA